MSSMPTGVAALAEIGLKVGDSFAPGMLTRWCRVRVAAIRDRGEPIERLLAGLGAGERMLAESLWPEGRRRDFALGRLAAREAIRRALGAARPRRDPEILRGRRGEPVVRGDGRLRGVGVSVTHAKGLAAACAWRAATFSAGIDIERVRPTDILDGTYAFSRRERGLLRRIGDRRLAALVGWAVKEASWKALTLGPRDGPETLEIAVLEPVAGRAVVRVTPRDPPRLGARLAYARVGRIRAPDGDHVVSLAWCGGPGQN